MHIRIQLYGDFSLGCNIVQLLRVLKRLAVIAAGSDIDYC